VGGGGGCGGVGGGGGGGGGGGKKRVRTMRDKLLEGQMFVCPDIDLNLIAAQEVCVCEEWHEVCVSRYRFEF